MKPKQRPAVRWENTYRFNHMAKTPSGMTVYLPDHVAWCLPEYLGKTIRVRRMDGTTTRAILHSVDRVTIR